MQIVTDRWADLSQQTIERLGIRFIPTVISLGDTVYSDELLAEPEAFYDAMADTGVVPTSRLPSASELADFYRDLATQDQEILSVHVSSGIKPAVELARDAARMAREANVTVVDSRAISLAMGWQVESAAMAADRGWPIGRIQSLLDRIRKGTDVVCAPAGSVTRTLMT